jgi:hypothetical protein
MVGGFILVALICNYCGSRGETPKFYYKPNDPNRNRADPPPDEIRVNVANLPDRTAFNHRAENHNFRGNQQVPRIVAPMHINQFERERINKLDKEYREKEAGQHIGFNERQRRQMEERKFVEQYGVGERYIQPAVRRKMQADVMKQSSMR